MKAHVIGICGVGMSATALLMKEAGWEVTGSDTLSYGPTGRILSAAGITPKVGYAPSNIPDDVDLFVIGRNAKLSSEENEEVRAACSSGKPIKSFPEVIGELTAGRDVAVVAGSYGKSSTTALLATALYHVGRAGYFVGAEPLTIPAPARLGEGLFVAEGDEYPSAHNDPRAKFMHLHPRDVILTSVVHDHVNVYPTFEDYKKPFEELLVLVPSDGLVVVCAEEPGALALAEASGKPLVSYGVEKGTYQAANVVYGEETTFTLTKDGAPIADLWTRQLGRHNVENMVAAATYLLERGIIAPAHLALALGLFGGVRRRLDRVTPDTALPTYEGFGSSYEKACAAIEAIRLHFPKKKLVVVFEPHTFGWRNRANLAWYDSAFKEATTVFVAPPESQGKGSHDQLTHEEILGRVRASGAQAIAYDAAHPEAVAASLSGEEVVLILSSGDFEGSLSKMIEGISNR